jgi:hypothetical protein
MSVTVSRASAATVSFTTPQEIVITHTDDSIKIGDGVDLLAITAAGAALVDGTATNQPITPATTRTLATSAVASSPAILTKAVLSGVTDSGSYRDAAFTGEGHLEVAIHGPRNPFGSLHAESLTPIIQNDAVYGLNTTSILSTTNASGTVTAANSMFVCQTGTTIYGAGSLQSRRRLRYRPGQGIIARFTALFTTPVASSYQIAGLGHPEDGIYFGYKDTTFGILYINRGVREIRTLTVTTASTTTENITVKLNNVDTTVAVTNSASTVKTAYEIASGTYTGWKAEQIGSTVVFVKDAVGLNSSTFSVTGTTVVGAFAQTLAGAAVVESFIAQSTWNGDKMNGTGYSGVTIDPTKLNVFQIGVQYLGAGAITFQVEAAFAGNNPEWVNVHTMLLPNTLTATTWSNPSFPLTMSAYSAGSTTNLTVKSGSFAGFIEGEKKLVGPRYSYLNSVTTVGSTNLQCLFTVRNQRIYGGKANQGIVNLVSIGAALKHTSPCFIYLIKNAVLAGTPNFAVYSVNSLTCFDTAATTCTYASNDQLIWVGLMGDTGDIDFAFSDEITLQPGETLTVAAKAVTGTPSYVAASLNTREDQ